VHQRTSADVYWTTVNATEAIPGTATPLTWSFYDDASELALRETFALMGVLRRRDVALPASTDERFIGIFHGHPAANLNRFRLMADLAPGGSGDALEQQFFGTVRSGVEPVSTRRRYPIFAARSPLVMWRAPGRVHALSGEAQGWWEAAKRGTRARGAAARGTGDARDRQLLRDGADLYRRILVWHGAATMLTQGLYDQLGRVCGAAGMPGGEVVLVGGLRGLEESAMLDDIWAHAHGSLSRETVVERHGFHGPDEGELSATVWRESPQLIDTLAATFREMAADASPAAKTTRSATAAADAGRRLLAGSGATARARIRVLLALTRRLMPLREVGRGAIVRALDGTRAAARRIGAAAASDGWLSDMDDVFFLTIDELAAGVPDDARGLVTARRARHAECLAVRLPDGWRGDPQLLPAIVSCEASEIAGVAGSPGTVEGIARVITSPEDGHALEPGEILVCHTTDPGWAALMQISAGLVIDVGGPLSHGAIVARELGLPCVIGTRDGTAAVRTGDRVRVDGGTGHVLILERNPAPV
jgi:phosphohistidine swiveling domain-containing protein